MATIQITYSQCGHTAQTEIPPHIETRNLAGINDWKRYRQLKFVCPACYPGLQEKKYENDAQFIFGKYRAGKLPELQGSAKQIVFAKKVRAKILLEAHQAFQHSNWADRILLEAWVKWVQLNDHAWQWLDERNLTAEQLIAKAREEF